MRRPFTSITNPINNPASSPSWSPSSKSLDEASSLTTAVPSQSTTITELPALPAPTTPAATTHVLVVNDNRGVEVSTATSSHRITTGDGGQADLPELPLWALHALAGTLSFLFVVTVVLILAQLPPRLTWLSTVERSRQPGYTKLEQDEEALEQDEEALDDELLQGSSSAVEAGMDRNEYEMRVRSERGVKRRANHLSIDTSAQYYGLGIAVPGGDDEEREVVVERGSYDQEALHTSGKSAVARAWQAFTAPLPSVETFTNVIPGRKKSTNTSGRRSPARSRGIASSDLSISPRQSSHLSEPASIDEAETDSGVGLLQRVNDGIYAFADKLSRTFYDDVVEAEQGLLLPVRWKERERGLTPGVFMD